MLTLTDPARPMLHPLFAALALGLSAHPAPATHAAPLPRGEDAVELDYAALAADFRERHGVSGGPGSTTLQRILDTPAYKRFNLGLFDLRVSSECLVDRDSAELFIEAAKAIVALQRSWYESAGANDERFEEVMEAFETLYDWVDDWSTFALKSVGNDDTPDVLDRLGAGDNAEAAHALIEDTMTRGKYLGLDLSPEPDSQILFAKDRGEFLRTIGFTGWNLKDQRHRYWKKGVEQWTSFWDDETQVIAMEYPSYPVDMRRPERGAPMDEFEKTGLGQHAAEKATATMFWRYYGDNDALFFEAAMGTILTIDVFEENNVRTGAPVFKSSGGASQAFEVFVPGGNPSGGTLTGRGAVSIIESPLWRKTLGSDYYKDPLKEGMEDGYKLAKKERVAGKDKRLHFVIEGPVQHDTTFVTAPFFGAHTKDKKLPEKKYFDDYEEFFRSYRASFFHWLRKRALGRDEEENREVFSTLIHRLANRGKNETFEAILQDLYGLPFSTPELEEGDSLESKFLTYIYKGR